QSTGMGLHVTQTGAGQVQSIPAQSLDLVDWQQVYLDVLEYKQARGMSNLVVPSSAVLRTIAASNCCHIVAEAHMLLPQSPKDWHKLQQVVTRLLCLYVDQYYRTYCGSQDNCSSFAH
ncbi:MAG: hypothetical protein NZM04_09460, partial [Methylacidiphilales bacterium]|nr:hypothetical protein [Candidatus Methylacidiphilales bacterium]